MGRGGEISRYPHHYTRWFPGHYPRWFPGHYPRWFPGHYPRWFPGHCPTLGAIVADWCFGGFTKTQVWSWVHPIYSVR